MPTQGVSIVDASQIAGADLDGTEIVPCSKSATARAFTLANLTTHLNTQLYSTIKGEVTIQDKNTNYTVTETDKGTILRFTQAGAATVTFPADAGENITVGALFHVLQWGAGQVSVAVGGGANLRTTEGTSTREQYSTVTVYKVASNEWLLYGDTSLT